MSSKIVEALKTIDYKDVFTRAMWTFVQAVLAVVLIVSDQLIELAFAGDWQALYALAAATGIGSVAAGLSALKTVILGVISEIKNKSV